MSLRNIAALALAGAMLSTAAQAAVPLPLAKFSGATSYNSFSGFGLNSTSHSDSFGTVGAEVTALGGLKAHVWGSTTTTGYGEIAEAMIRYYFAIVSPIPGSIDVLIDAGAGVGGGGSYFAEAEVDLFGSEISKTLAYAHACNAVGFCVPSQNVSANGGKSPVSLIANRVYEIRLTANGHTTNPLSSFDAYADPTITFAPGADVPLGAFIQYSENLFGPTEVPAGSVPEPATWAMMLLGFGGTGAILRRRRTALA